MATTLGHGVQKQYVTEMNKGIYHGTDFESLIEGLNAGQSFTDLDDVGRAHLLGLLQGLELARSMRLENWDLQAPFYEFES